MRVKTTDLNGIALDWAVAMAEGGHSLRYDTVACWWFTLDGKDRVLSRAWSASQNWAPSEDWEQAGSIIDREHITVCAPIVRRISAEQHAFPVPYWRAMKQRDENELAVHGRGPTATIAAMRCYVTCKLGDEIEVPDYFKGKA